MIECYRCGGKLKRLRPWFFAKIRFYQCKRCKCQYALEPSKPMCDRWGMPLTLVLYGVIFDENPLLKSKTIAEEFAARDDLDIEMLKKHIKDELENPKQSVSDLHEFVCSDEKTLRKFLGAVLHELEKIPF